MPLLMDDILVTMNEVDLTIPTCISLIVATSEVYTLPISSFYHQNSSDTQIHNLSSYLIVCLSTVVTEIS
jgi:hypothetical protein